MFVMIIEIDAGALTLAVPARDAPIADRSFDLFRLAVRYRLRDAALIPPRDRARSEARENTDRDEGILLQPHFDRKSGVEGKSGSGRVVLGVRRSCTQK